MFGLEGWHLAIAAITITVVMVRWVIPYIIGTFAEVFEGERFAQVWPLVIILFIPVVLFPKTTKGFLELAATPNGIKPKRVPVRQERRYNPSDHYYRYNQARGR